MDSEAHHHASLYSEEKIKSDLQEWESKYSSTDRTAKMLQQLQETHSTGVDTLMKLGEQGEQMDRIERLANEQEQHVKGLGKYKKFHKYMKKLSKKDPKEKPKPKEINHELNIVEARHHANEVIMKKREQDRLLEMEQKRLRDNPPGGETVEGQGLSSKLWRKSGDIKRQAEVSAEHSRPITEQNEEDLRDNVYIKNASWIKVEDEHLDQMNLILADMKNVAIATHTEVQRQSLKLDDIGQSMDRGNNFDLKKKSSRQIEKEKKKAIKEEEKRLEDANRKKAIVDAKVEQEIGHKPLYKSKYFGRHEKVNGGDPSGDRNPFL